MCGPRSAARRARPSLNGGNGPNAWVGLWGVAEGVDAGRALADMQAALAEGWFEVGGNRPTDWSGAWVATADVEAEPAPSGAMLP